MYATDATWLEWMWNKEMDSADTLDEQESDSNTLDSDVDPKSATEMFRVPERPWDLASLQKDSSIALHKGVIHCTSGIPSRKHAPNLSALYTTFKTFSSMMTYLYFTTTDNGVTGGLSMWQDNQPVLLHTQADDGTLMR